MQNSLCVKVLHSSILAALLHGTPAVGVRQTLQRGTRNGITELSLLVIFIMAALPTRCGHYILQLWFLSFFFLLSFFPRLISAVADWMSTIPPWTITRTVSSELYQFLFSVLFLIFLFLFLIPYGRLRFLAAIFWALVNIAYGIISYRNMSATYTWRRKNLRFSSYILLNFGNNARQ